MKTLILSLLFLTAASAQAAMSVDTEAECQGTAGTRQVYKVSFEERTYVVSNLQVWLVNNYGEYLDVTENYSISVGRGFGESWRLVNEQTGEILKCY